MNGGRAARAALQIRIVAWSRTAGLPVPRWKVTRTRSLYLPGRSVTRGVTFLNVRLGSPMIAIDKVGPASATAGDTLRYQLFVTNPGYVSFPAASVEVVDPNCDEPPALVGRADAAGADDTPRTLDPGDIWTYSCSKKTAASEDCRPSVVTNTAVVTGEAGGSRVRDDSRVDTALTCPQSLPSQSNHLRRHRSRPRSRLRLRRPLCHRGRHRRTPMLQRQPVPPSVRPSPGAFAAGLRESTWRAHGSLASACS